MKQIMETPPIDKNKPFVRCMYKTTETAGQLRNVDLYEYEKLKLKEEFYLAYSFMVAECCTIVSDCNSEVIKTQYLDYIKWNKSFIDQNFSKLHSDEKFVSFSPNVAEFARLVQADVDKMYNENFAFTSVEKSHINEYQHAYGIAHSTDKENFVRTLGHRFRKYLAVINRHKRFADFGGEKTLDDVTKEANFIIEAVRRIDAIQAADLQVDWRSFQEAVKDDDNCRKLQNTLLGDAVTEEYYLQEADRIEKLQFKCQQIVEKIRCRLTTQVNQVMNYGLFRPLIHPVQTYEDLKYAGKHFFNSMKALFKWMRENPWKAVLYSVGGCAIGVSAFCFTVWLLPFAAAVEIPIAVGIGAVVGTVYFTLTAASAGALAGAAGRLTAKAEAVIKEETSDYVDELNRIKETAGKLRDEMRREQSIRNRMEAENVRLAVEMKRLCDNMIRRRQEDFYRMEEEERRIDEETNRQLAIMPDDRLMITLQAAEKDLLEAEEIKLQSEEKRNIRLQRMALNENLNIVAREGREAAQRALQINLDNDDAPFEHPTID